MLDVSATDELTLTSLPQEIISCLQSEQDLTTLLQELETNINSPKTETIDSEPVAAEINETEQDYEPVYLHQPDRDQLQNSINSQHIAASEPEQEYEPVSLHQPHHDQLQNRINSQRKAASKSQKQ